MQFLGFAVIICLVQTFDYSFACNGYDVTLISITNGPNNPTLVVQPDPKIFLDENCQLYLEGCLDILRPVSSVELSFIAKRKGILTVLDVDNVDLCQLLANSNYPNECPLSEGEYSDAFNNPIDLSKYQKYLPRVVGNITVAAKIVTNNNEVNTFIVKLEIASNI